MLTPTSASINTIVWVGGRGWVGPQQRLVGWAQLCLVSQHPFKCVVEAGRDGPGSGVLWEGRWRLLVVAAALLASAC